jgi:hypothetical protein
MDLMVLSTRFGRHHYQIVLQMTNVIQITAGVQADIPEGDTDALERSLTFIHQVRTKQNATAASFVPLHNMVSLLKRHGISLTEGEIKMLDDAPVRWQFTVDRVYKVT